MADELNMTEGAVRVAVHRIRRKYGALLREEVAQTVADPQDVDRELRELLLVLGETAR
jgi:RNA polymerase sigma-70 factor (ECF subfamily)